MISSKYQIFIDKAEDTLSSFIGLKTQFVSSSKQSINTDIAQKSILSTIVFSGEITGDFTLIFPIDTAVSALEFLLGEKVGLTNIALLKDGIGELSNIVMGAVKTQFDEINKKVAFELPVTYKGIDEIYNNIILQDGVWIKMKLQEKPFYMFISQ